MRLPSGLNAALLHRTFMAFERLADRLPVAASQTRAVLS